jgi:hypothetical protein
MGFSSTRVEHLLNKLVMVMPVTECYFEVGVLAGRTLESASIGNDSKRLIGCDVEDKYNCKPLDFGTCVNYYHRSWRDLTSKEIPLPIGVVFYDGSHDSEETKGFMLGIRCSLADEAVLVLDDWDRKSVRSGAFLAAEIEPAWRLLREMPEYTDGLSTAPHHFGYFFGVSLWGFKR